MNIAFPFLFESEPGSGSDRIPLCEFKGTRNPAAPGSDRRQNGSTEDREKHS